MFTGFLLSAILYSGSRLDKLLRASWLRSCGKYSYAMYVFHLPMEGAAAYGVKHYCLKASMNTVFDVTRMPAVMVYIIVMSLASYAVARISWAVFEWHFYNLKKYF
jgi:peptidoglycan/LPS O-acetylase OafA/YrhL